MIRVLICGNSDPAWRQDAESFLTRDWEDYKKGIAAGTFPQEDPRLPRVYPLFSENEDELRGQLNRFHPQVIVSLRVKPKPLLLMSLHDRKKWHHFEEIPSLPILKQTVYGG